MATPFTQEVEVAEKISRALLNAFPEWQSMSRKNAEKLVVVNALARIAPADFDVLRTAFIAFNTMPEENKQGILSRIRAMDTELRIT